jgi:glycine hydroxymethyltransferase
MAGLTGQARNDGEKLFTAVARDHNAARRSLNLTPSENTLSPLARLPFTLDVASRYFFDHLSKFGSWSFYGALGAGEIEYDMLLPLLRGLADAPFVNVQPLSGLSCMTVAMSALTHPGQTVVTVPVDAGGHMSTAGVANRLGLRVLSLPMDGPFSVDLDAMRRLLAGERPQLIYIDQSTQLFPIDPAPLRELLTECSPDTLLHYDASHLNGLILFGAHPNPLDHGADTFGGSTHKTLPGPHKGFLATRDPALAERINASADTFISHHHPASVVSLAITLVELQHCGGRDYARQVVVNARTLAETLHSRGVAVAAPDRDYTGCHQVWVDHKQVDQGVSLTDRLRQAGLVVNRVGVPGVTGSALRLSSAEITRRGAGTSEIALLADLLSEAIIEGAGPDELSGKMRELRRRVDRPRYCWDPDDLPECVPTEIRNLAESVRAVLGQVSEDEGEC